MAAATGVDRVEHRGIGGVVAGAGQLADGVGASAGDVAGEQEEGVEVAGQGGDAGLDRSVHAVREARIVRAAGAPARDGAGQLVAPVARDHHHVGHATFAQGGDGRLENRRLTQR